MTHYLLAEALDVYASNRSNARFHCVIVATGHEREDEHLDQAIKLAIRYDLPYTALGVKDAAQLLGYSADLEILASRHASEFPADEPVIMLTYWVQQVNFRLARDNGRSAILFGFNREDIIAEALYLMLLGRVWPSFPSREASGVKIVSPLRFVPKSIIDAADLTNSMRNYRQRWPSRGALRSLLYFAAHRISEDCAEVAEAFVGPPLQGEGDPDILLGWRGQYNQKGES